MRRVVTLGLSGALLIAVVGLSAAQPKVEKGRATDAAAGKPATQQVCGQVTQVDDKAKTFTLSAKGKIVTLDAAQVKPLPKVGETVDVTYVVSGDPSKGATLRGNTIKVVWQEGKK